MQFLQDVNIDWIGKVKYFLVGSLVMLLLGGYAVMSKGGLPYGIDFKGGTLVYVRFAEPPQIDQVRSALAAQGLGNSTIQTIRDPLRAEARELVIYLEQLGDADAALEAGKEAILGALSAAFGGPAGGKADLNAATPEALEAYLSQRDVLGVGVTGAEQYKQLATRITGFRDSERSGLIASFDELTQVEGVTPQVRSALEQGFDLGAFAVRNVEIVGPRVGGQLRRQAVLATVYALLGMLVYIAFRFEWVYGAAAVLAVVHDVFITLGLFTLFNYEISLTVIAALLTLVGYSMNDTIVIFDRVRENLRTMRRLPFREVVNKSINQTLARTVLTSGLTFLAVLALFLLGGEVLRSFSFALVVGIVVGTYSSVGIAAALIVGWAQWRGQQAVARKTA
ncbi:MAG TPA: protein translocase subunit SecF [Candidatus Acidoferrales bacterium]